MGVPLHLQPQEVFLSLRSIDYQPRIPRILLEAKESLIKNALAQNKELQMHKIYNIDWQQNVNHLPIW